ncbi:MAG: hypothetical protein CSA82_03520 [Actinobacteria bacterium]|nr:MAG: hypothetical protein CSA82_03520 [Actinomycetota bacterium]
MVELHILGSCVTRDAVPFLDKNRWGLGLYVARQSFLSIHHPVSHPTLTQFHFTSRFQDRMYHGDLQGNAIELLRQHVSQANVDEQLLVIDLIDERSGIMRNEDGSVFTRSIEILRTNLLDSLDDSWHRHSLGSTFHFFAFVQAAASVKEALMDMGMWERTRVLMPQWALTDEEGQPVPISLGLKAKTANDIYAAYYKVLSESGWHLLSPEATPLAAADHQWGPAAFHYTDNYYKAICSALETSLKA